MLPNEVRLELINDTSRKFWQYHTDNDNIAIQYGRIGTKRQKVLVPLTSLPNRVRQKLSEGYKPTLHTMTTLLGGLPIVTIPKVIGTVYLGHHINEALAQDLADWLTMCLHSDMSLKQFKNVWNKYLYEEDEGLVEALGVSCQFNDVVYWEDEPVEGFDFIASLYESCLKEAGDRFVWYDEDGDVFVVCCRGVAEFVWALKQPLPDCD